MRVPVAAQNDARGDDGEGLVVVVEAGRTPISTKWEADGDFVGQGLEVSWRPDAPTDRIRVAIRSRGGVAVLSMRAEDAKPVATA